MSTIPSMPQPLTAVLPFLALIITSWLQHSTLPKWANVLIVLLFPLFLATLWALLGDALTSNLSGDITILVTLCYAVMALSDMAGVRAWLQSTLTSPFALVATATPEEPEPAITASPGPTTPYATPQGIDLQALPPSRRPQFVDPSPSLHSRPIVQITVPLPTTPAPEPEPPTPVEESPAPTEQS